MANFPDPLSLTKRYFKHIQTALDKGIKFKNLLTHILLNSLAGRRLCLGGYLNYLQIRNGVEVGHGITLRGMRATWNPQEHV